MKKIYMLIAVVSAFFTYSAATAQNGCNTLSITSSTGDAVCGGGDVLLTATASGTGSGLYWYDAATGGKLVEIGDTLRTSISATTSYYATEVLIGTGGGKLPKNYCVPVAPSSGCIYGDNIDDFKMTDADGNVLLNHKNSGCSNKGYKDFSGNKNLSVDLIVERDYDFSISHGFTNQDPGQFVSIWIDLNRDSSFDDVGELVFSSSKGTTGGGLSKGSFSIPASAKVNPTMMRVVVRHGSAATDPCNIGGTYGEVHDYKVNIVGMLCESTPRTKVDAVVNNQSDKQIKKIPYKDTADTANFGDHYSGVSGDCAVSGDYLEGNEVVYHYKADGDYALQVDMSALSKVESAVFVYESCADIGSNCIAGATNFDGTKGNYSFRFSVVSGQDYYFVVSSTDTTDTVGYTMNIGKVSCGNLALTSTTGASVCGEGSVRLTATASGNGDGVYWYDAATGGEIVSRDSFFKTPELDTITSYWAAEVTLAGTTLSGQGEATPHSSSTYTYDYYKFRGLAFTATKSFTIVDVEVFSTGSGGPMDVLLLDDQGNTMSTASFTLPSGSTSSPVPQTLKLNFVVPGPGDYYLGASTTAGCCTFSMSYSGYDNSLPFPYPLGTAGEVTAGAYATSGSPYEYSYYYYFFYNWTITDAEVICESPREEVVATVNDVADVEINKLNYSHSADTGDYQDNYIGEPGDGCGASQDYLEGNEVVYHYEATDDFLVNIKMSGLTGGPSGVFVYKSCDDIGTACVAGAVEPQGATDYDFDFSMQKGEDYYVVISGKDEDENVGYTLEITKKAVKCADYKITATTGGEAICAGQIVLTAKGGGAPGAEIYWYDAATGGNLVFIGPVFKTPKLAATTSFWVAEGIAEGPGGDVDATVICESSPRKEVIATVTTTPDVAIGPVGGSVSYKTSDNTANYTDIYEGEPGCNDDSYLNGNDVVYRFTANSDGIIDIVLSDLTEFYAGVFVYEDCSSLGDECMASAVAGPSDDDFRIDNMEIKNGEDYYVVLSSWLSPNYGYTLEIIPCEVGLPTAEKNQLFVQGEALADLDVTKTSEDVTLQWYSDAAGTNPIPDTTVLQDATTYYVRQIYGASCQGPLLAVTVSKIKCDALAITSSKGGQASCKGAVTLNAKASGSGSNIYWYDAPTAGNIVGLGETFETPVLTQTTDYYASEVQSLDGGALLGQGLPAPTGSYDSYTYDYYKFRGLAFTATKSFIILDVQVFTTGAQGPMDVGLYDDKGDLVTSKSFTLPSGGTSSAPIAVTLSLNFVVPVAGDYYLGVSAQVPCCSFYMSAEYQYPSLGIWPIPLGSSGEITSSAYSSGSSTYTYDQYYYFLYNWSILEGDIACESLPRTKVTATVNQSGNVLVDAQKDLPYTSTDNSGQYPNNFSGDPGADCQGSDYLNGNEVIYQFKADPTKDDIIDIELTGLNNPNTGLYIYDDCGLIGTTCLTGDINDGGSSIKIEDFYVDAGDDIFIVVSTQTSSVNYTINITRVECDKVQPPTTADATPFFATGDMLSDLNVDGNIYNEGFKWYTKVDGKGKPVPSSEIDPTTVNVKDGKTYYVTQTILGCEGVPLKITPEEFPCGDMKILSASEDVTFCAPGGEVEFTAKGTGLGDDVFWYDAPTDGNVVYIGEKFSYTASQTTSFYAKEVFMGDPAPLTGQGMVTPGGSDDDYIYDYYPYKGLIFTADKPFTIIDVEVFSTGIGGTMQVLLLDDQRNTVNSASFTIPSGTVANPTPVTLKLGFFVTPGEYVLGASTADGCCDFSMQYETTGSFPVPLGTSGEITYGEYASGSYVYDENDYNFFYNWTISEPEEACASAPTEFKVTVNDNTYPTTANRNQKFCEGAIVEDLMTNSEGETLWYKDRMPETGPMSPDTKLKDGETYYVSQVVVACESPRRYPVTVKIVPIATLPVAARNQGFNQGATIDSLEVKGTNLTWYYDKDDDGDLDEVEDPSTVVLEDQETYYVSQYPKDFCESAMQPITVHLLDLGTEDPVFEDLAYYPNPVQHELNISSGTSQIESVVLFDLRGRKVLGKKVDARKTNLDTYNLQSGVYMLRVTIEGKTGVFKIVKE